MITAIIMASGFSRRMGKDKLFLKINDMTLIEQTIKTIKESKVDDIIIVYRDERIKKFAKKHDILPIYNKNAGKGQSESIKLGIKSARKESMGYMFFVGDQPNLSGEVINDIINKFKKNKDKIIIPLYDKKRGNPIIFPRYLREELLEIKGDSGGRVVIENNIDIVDYIQYDNSFLGIDIDTAEDYKKLKKGE